jgi:hypothetical protein
MMDNINEAINTGNSDTQEAVDSAGTDQEQGRAILQALRDKGFEGSDEKFAVALGRPIEEVAGWMNGEEPVDDDVVMKARGIALQRGIEIE